MFFSCPSGFFALHVANVQIPKLQLLLNIRGVFISLTCFYETKTEQRYCFFGGPFLEFQTPTAAFFNFPSERPFFFPAVAKPTRSSQTFCSPTPRRFLAIFPLSAHFFLRLDDDVNGPLPAVLLQLHVRLLAFTHLLLCRGPDGPQTFAGRHLCSGC